MEGVWNLNNDRLNLRQVGRERDSIIQKPSVFHHAIVTVDVLLVERPSNALHGATLVLPFNVTWVNGFPRVLNRRVANDVGFARFLVYFDVAQVDGKARPCSPSVDIGSP